MIKKFNSLLYYSITYQWYKLTFRFLGNRVRIVKPLKLEGKKNILVGNRTYVGAHSWLAALPLTGKASCLLQIDEGCGIGNFNHIYATSKIHIQKKVLTADKVYISDNLHHYENISMAVIDQPIRQLKEVVIGEGSWLGENVCIIGASVGKHCIIGANSVVTKDIPDYSVAVGSPAKVIKQYDQQTDSWIKV